MPTLQQLLGKGSTLLTPECWLIAVFQLSDSRSNRIIESMVLYRDVIGLRIVCHFQFHGASLDIDLFPSVIPDYAKLSYIVRAPTGDEVKELSKRVIACFEYVYHTTHPSSLTLKHLFHFRAAAVSTGCDVKVSPGIPYTDVIQNDVLGKIVHLWMS